MSVDRHSKARSYTLAKKRKRSLHVFTEESQHGLVTLLILFLDLRLRQVPTRSHESVDLVLVVLDELRSLQVSFVGLDRRDILVHRRQQRHGDRHGSRVVRVHHCRMALYGSFEAAILACGQGRDFAAPAVSQDAPAACEPA